MDSSQPPSYGLTEREQDVTRLVLQGSSTAQIAESLVISSHTVQQHLKRSSKDGHPASDDYSLQARAATLALDWS